MRFSRERLPRDQQSQQFPTTRLCGERVERKPNYGEPRSFCARCWCQATDVEEESKRYVTLRREHSPNSALNTHKEQVLLAVPIAEAHNCSGFNGCSDAEAYA